MQKKGGKMRFSIKSVYKRPIIIILFLLLSAGITLLALDLLPNQTMEKEQTVLKFTSKPEVSYQVLLKQNILYNERTQPEDLGYFNTLIDSILVTMKIQYSADKEAELKGDYILAGEIIGLETGGDDPVIAWSKRFPISSKKEFSTDGRELTFAKDSTIDYNHFSEFADQVDELTGYKTTHKLKVTMNLNYTVTTPEGQASKVLQPAVVIPLGEKFFKITKADNDEQTGTIEKTVQEAAPLDPIKVIAISAVCLICTIALFLLLFRTEEPSLLDYQRKAAGKLLKEHGKRLVALNENLLDSCLEVFSVYSMDDMIKISDEIERPIFYVHQKELSNLREFYIIENERAYLFYFNHFPNSEEVEIEKQV